MLGNLFDVLFDSDFYSFNRMVRDKRPYQIINEKGFSTIIHNIVGIDAEDVKIDIVPIDERHSYLSIKGETKEDLLEKEFYNVKSRFTIRHGDIDKITKKVKNGILYLTVKWKTQEKPKLQIQILEE